MASAVQIQSPGIQAANAGKGEVNMYNFTDEFWNEVRNHIDYLTSASNGLNGLNGLDDIEVEELVILRLLLKNYSKEV